MIELISKNIKLLPQNCPNCYRSYPICSQVDGLARFVGRGFGALGGCEGEWSGRLRFLEFFLSMHNALDAPLELFRVVSNAFKSSKISGLVFF